MVFLLLYLFYHKSLIKLSCANGISTFVFCQERERISFTKVRQCFLSVEKTSTFLEFWEIFLLKIDNGYDSHDKLINVLSKNYFYPISELTRNPKAKQVLNEVQPFGTLMEKNSQKEDVQISLMELSSVIIFKKGNSQIGF